MDLFAWMLRNGHMSSFRLVLVLAVVSFGFDPYQPSASIDLITSRTFIGVAYSLSSIFHRPLAFGLLKNITKELFIRVPILI